MLHFPRKSLLSLKECSAHPARYPHPLLVALRNGASSATIWEIAIKVRLGRLNANVDEIIDQVSVRDLHPLPVTFAHAKRVANLELHHKDPFDRLLIAQALSEPLHLVTVDEQLKPYSDLIICLNSP